MSGKQMTGVDVLHDPWQNKGTAFTQEEREQLGLRGLLPAAVSTQQQQVERILENLRRKDSDIERYIFLSLLQGRNERLFFRTIVSHIEETMPIIYTPTVGQACKEFAHIYRQARGFYVTPDDRGRVRELLDHWPESDVRVVVITDGERILGLGDLGANGMGIPIGKLALYTACAGIDPRQCLPVMLDVGTNNEELLNDPLYLGVRQHRLTGAEYFELVDEFMAAVQDAYPLALVQFEDFVTANAFALLGRYRDRALCFNDDIQGTAAVALAGVLAAEQATGVPWAETRVLFLGAGSAATGIGDLMVQSWQQAGLDQGQARGRIGFVDSGGLVTSNRDSLAEHKRPYARDEPPADFLESVRRLRPHVLIGATGTPGTFTQEAVALMAEMHETPVIMALSNPTSRAECTAEQAYRWSEGRAVFASGSPFPEIMVEGQQRRPAQANNAYIFPGMGLGVLAASATRVTDSMFMAAARRLADQVTPAQIRVGSLYPPLTQIRDVSQAIAVAVAEAAFEDGVAGPERPTDLASAVGELVWSPDYT